MTTAKLYRIGNQEATLRYWCTVYLKPIATVRTRMRRGADIEEALLDGGDWRQARLTVGDETRTLAGWARLKKLPVRLIRDRRKRGCTPEEQVAPVRVDGFEAFGRHQSYTRWGKEKEMGRNTLKYRIEVLGMAPELALSLPVAKQGKRRRKIA